MLGDRLQPFADLRMSQYKRMPLPLCKDPKCQRNAAVSLPQLFQAAHRKLEGSSWHPAREKIRFSFFAPWRNGVLVEDQIPHPAFSVGGGNLLVVITSLAATWRSDQLFSQGFLKSSKKLESLEQIDPDVSLISEILKVTSAKAEWFSVH